MSGIKLFLDDVRTLDKAYPQASRKSVPDGIYKQEWVIVRSYEAFVDHISKNGLPELISFDFDLGEDIARKMVEKGMNKKEARRMYKQTAKSGLDCAKWLIRHCRDNNLSIPDWIIHSSNESGIKEIKRVLEGF